MRHFTTLAILLAAVLALPGCGCGGDEGLMAVAATPQPNAPMIRAGGIVFQVNRIIIPRALQTRMLGERDPMGAPLSSIVMEIWKDGEQVGTATTNDEGQYIFSDTNVTGGLMPSTEYQMRLSFETNGERLGFVSPILPNEGEDDQMDSDGDPSIEDGFVVAPFSTPADGDDFSIDFGFQGNENDA